MTADTEAREIARRLSPAQRRLLREADKNGIIQSADFYPPARKLREYGCLELRSGRWSEHHILTNLGFRVRAILAAESKP